MADRNRDEGAEDADGRYTYEPGDLQFYYDAAGVKRPIPTEEIGDDVEAETSTSSPTVHIYLPEEDE